MKTWAIATWAIAIAALVVLAFLGTHLWLIGMTLLFAAILLVVGTLVFDIFVLPWWASRK